MTREEAIQYLIDVGISPEHTMEIVESLEQEPCTVTEFADRCMECGKLLGNMIMIKQCEDCVSREAVMNGILADEYMQNHINGDVWERIEDIVDALPPVQPKQKSCDTCKYNGVLSLDCGRCDDECSQYEPKTEKSCKNCKHSDKGMVNAKSGRCEACYYDGRLGGNCLFEEKMEVEE